MSKKRRKLPSTLQRNHPIPRRLHHHLFLPPCFAPANLFCVLLSFLENLSPKMKEQTKMSSKNQKEKHREATFICLALELKESSNSGLPCTKSDHITSRNQGTSTTDLIEPDFLEVKSLCPFKQFLFSIYFRFKKRVRLGRTPEKSWTNKTLDYMVGW